MSRPGRWKNFSGGVPEQTPESRVEEYKDFGKVPVVVFYPDGGVPTPVARPSLFRRMRQMARLTGHMLWRNLGFKRGRHFLHLPQ